MGSYVIREYKTEDKEKVFGLIKTNFIDIYDKIYTIWDWLFLNNPFNPNGSAHILVSELNSEIIGLICHIFVDLKINNKITKARWGCIFVVHPKYRGKGIMLFKKSMEIPYYPYLGFPDKRTLILETKLGTSYFGFIYNQICILDMKIFLQNKLKNKFLSYLGGTTWSLIYKVLFTRKIYTKDVFITQIESFDKRFDKFWEDICSYYPIIVVRNQKYLNWRFIESPFKYYIFTANKNNHLLGYLILRIKEKRGIKRGYIVDILANPNDRVTINLLISKAVSFFKENKYITAECLLLANKVSYYYKALKRYGFLIKKSKVYFDGYSKDKEELDFIKNLDNWFITASDPDLEIWA